MGAWNTPLWTGKHSALQKALNRGTYKYTLTWLLARRTIQDIEQRGLRTAMGLKLEITCLLKYNGQDVFLSRSRVRPEIFLSNKFPSDTNGCCSGTCNLGTGNRVIQQQGEVKTTVVQGWRKKDPSNRTDLEWSPDQVANVGKSEQKSREQTSCFKGQGTIG